jgi:predicted ArsR family transcriptional regulator
MAGENTIVEGAAIERETHVRTAVIDSENAALRDEQRNHVPVEADYPASAFGNFAERGGADPAAVAIVVRAHQLPHLRLIYLQTTRFRNYVKHELAKSTFPDTISLMRMNNATSERILYQLKTKGPQAAGPIAARLGVTAMAVRQHLYRLKQRGLVDYADERRPVGRPLRLWRLTPASASRFPDSHAELTLEVIDAVRAAFGESGLERLLHERTQRQKDSYARRMKKAGAGLLRRVQVLAEIRREQGYMAECVQRRDGSILMIENHCPICAAASSCQGLCREELSLFRSLFGVRARVERIDHILAGARRCAYMITPER